MIKNIASYVTVEGSRGIIYGKNSIRYPQILINTPFGLTRMIKI